MTDTKASGRVLVVGGGAREHALALALLRSPAVGEVVMTPGNGGGALGAPRSLAGKRLSNAAGAPLELARRLAPDLCVIGPEAPLCAGLADDLSEAGWLVYGPSRDAARLEGSKAFLKAFATEHQIATAPYRIVRAEGELEEALSAFPEPPVVKADGLCAGKGVVIASSLGEAERAARAMLSGEAFGDAGRVVVLEQRLEGAEVSVHAICDGTRGWLLPLVQDHKRIGEGDTGPNTGGMGTYGPVEPTSASLAEYFRVQLVEKVMAGMAKRGSPFRGTLFANFMLVEGGPPMLLEINVRFGDPETQILTNVVEADWYEVLRGAANGSLGPRADLIDGVQRHAVCVVLAAEGYPSSPRRGDLIEGLEAANSVDGACVYHAGTRVEDGAVRTHGGRVLGVTAVADSLPEAHRRAYASVQHVRYAGKTFRRDIAARAPGIAPLGSPTAGA